MLYLYAFVPADAPPPAEPDVELVDLGEVAAAVAEIEGAVEPTHARIVAHANVVDALAAANDAVLPVRFGRGFRDRDELEAVLAGHAQALHERLAEVRGCVELGLHVAAPPGPANDTAASGREYMQRRLADQTQAEAAADAIHTPLAELSHASTRSSSAGSAELLRVAYLVPRDGVERFRAAVEQAQRRHPELTFACTGPWPPYSFAALDAEAVA
jgi:Gas vesicle synthesis protein GvpL/GvpF